MAFLPHPPIIIPEVGKEALKEVRSTVKAMEALAREVAEGDPQRLIIISPHGPVFQDAIGIWGVEELKGDLAAFGAGQVRFSCPVDLDLARAVAEEAQREGIPVAWLDRNTSLRYGLYPRLDHGMMVPLYYLRKAGIEVPLVAMAPAFLPRSVLYNLGRCLKRAVISSPYRVLLVASGDLSHCLSPGAPAGFHPAGREFDLAIKGLLERGDVEGILRLPQELVDEAAECGYRPLLMALGALEGEKFKAEVLSYEAPFGVGYLVAYFRLASNPGSWRESSLPARLARQTLEHFLKTGEILSPPHPLPPELAGRAGVFVSIKKRGQLRGCIGTIFPTRSNIAEEIIYNALAAGLEDPRFPPVRLEELPELEFSVDILGEPEPAGPEDLDPKKYGVIVSCGRRRGLLLPDLEGVDTVEQQLSIALRKAGIRPDEPYRIERFQVKRYH